jgi:large subunit ribosomal protein L3
MAKTILGKKLGMTQVWSDDDRLIPVTVVEAGPCVVSQIKTPETDGYAAAQIAFGDLSEKKTNKPTAGHFAKAGVAPKRHVAEVRVEGDETYELGMEITCEVFEAGETIHVVGRSKGKGFAGVMKRHNYKGGPGGHGSHFHRAPGSIGQASTPSRVFKGLKLPGHMGDETVTVRNLEVVRVIPDQNLLLIKGAVPGGKNGLLTIRSEKPFEGVPVKAEPEPEIEETIVDEAAEEAIADEAIVDETVAESEAADETPTDDTPGESA